ncbi:MAG: hypothetical protein Q7R88_03295 [bacterium]|nr:hypothetical protein [bacterium]
MKILIATGIYPPDIGGPAQYAKGVEEVWRKQGSFGETQDLRPFAKHQDLRPFAKHQDLRHQVKVLAFSAVMRTSVLTRKLPTGIRHLYYFFRVLFSLPGVDFVFSPDTFSAALPALLAAKLLGKKIILRTGGDFLWEAYVERTGDLVLLKHFYQKSMRHFNLKERIIFHLVRFLFRHADAIIFSTTWQKDIFAEPYGLNSGKCFVVENYYGSKTRSDLFPDTRSDLVRKVFVGGTRELKWKNIPRVREAFEKVRSRGGEATLELQTGSRTEFLKTIENGYAVILASLGDVSPNTILEAIAFNKPFILTRETGLYERLKDIGLWVNPEDTEDIAQKIAWLSDEKNFEEQCRKVAAFTFTHSYEQIAEEILDVYART